MSQSGIPLVSDVAGAIGGATSGALNPVKPLKDNLVGAGQGVVNALGAQLDQAALDKKNAEQAIVSEAVKRRGRASTMLSGGAGVEDNSTPLARRTLLGA